MKLTKLLLNICIRKNITISTAESCTAGLLAAAITSEPGASNIFNEGFIVYSNKAKIRYLSVLEQTLSKYGAVSEEVAIEMASNCQKLTNSTIAISITGIAGPGTSESKPEGRVCFGIANDNISIVKTKEFGQIGRDNVRSQAVSYGLELLLKSLDV